MSCRDVIGVYEPLVLVDHRGAVISSRAAGAEPAELGQAQYHLACYERSFGIAGRPPAVGRSAGARSMP